MIVGGDTKSMLPFSERLDWNRAALFLPLARLTELHFLLRTFSDEDLFARKRQGNLFWRNYLATPDLSLLTALHVVRERLGIPPPVIEDIPAKIRQRKKVRYVKLASISDKCAMRNNYGSRILLLFSRNSFTIVKSTILL